MGRFSRFFGFLVPTLWEDQKKCQYLEHYTTLLSGKPYIIRSLGTSRTILGLFLSSVGDFRYRVTWDDFLDFSLIMKIERDNLFHLIPNVLYGEILGITRLKCRTKAQLICKFCKKCPPNRKIRIFFVTLRIYSDIISV